MAHALTTAIGTRRHLRSSWVWAFGLTGLIVAGAGAAAAMAGQTGVPLGFALIAFAAMMFPYMAFATTSFARDLGWWLRRNPSGVVQVALYFLLVYEIYAVGTGAFEWVALARVAAFVGIPSTLIWWAGRKPGVRWQDWVAVACIWIPFDFGLLNSIWTWPAGNAAYILNTAMAIDLAVALFAACRGFSGVTMRLRTTKAELLTTLAALGGFLVFALPFGFGTGFIEWQPKLELVKVLGTPLGIFFFIALPEELLFRGLVQNLLTQRLGRPWLALVLASVFFGATHLNNGPAPDWRYFVLATVAGFFYGWVYRRSRSLLAPALLHAAVDTLWVLFLHV